VVRGAQWDAQAARCRHQTGRNQTEVTVATSSHFHYRLPDPLSRWVNDGDEQRHPVENTLAFGSLGLGLISMICVGFGAWEAGAWLALGGGLVAAYDEFIAKTSGERWLIMLAFILSIVGMAVSMANGAIF